MISLISFIKRNSSEDEIANVNFLQRQRTGPPVQSTKITL